MTHDQSAQTEAGHSAAMALQSQAIKDSRFENVVSSLVRRLPVFLLTS